MARLLPMYVDDGQGKKSRAGLMDMEIVRNNTSGSVLRVSSFLENLAADGSGLYEAAGFHL
jgi:hypothetical protein